MTTKDTIDIFYDTHVTVDDNVLDSCITMHELDFALKRLKNSKSPGSDFLLNEFLKNSTFLFRKTLLTIFNHILNTGKFPEVWTLGLIVPIHKNGNINIPGNYRGITLLSCVSKLFTNILNLRLNKWAEQSNKFDNFQFGFREERSTIDALFILNTLTEIFLSKNKSLYVSFIDLRKAFDKTHHEALWFKLHENGVSTKVVKLIMNMYEKMKLCVKSSFAKSTIRECTCESSNDSDLINNSCNAHNDLYDFPNDTCIFSPAAGVLQGESLSPFLFSMFLNDINDYLRKDPHVGISIYQFYMTLLLFADDMVIVCDNRLGLQRGLNILYDYCSDWGLEVNVEKTKCMVFKKGGRMNKLDKWTYNGTDVETVNTFKYLGFLFGSSGKFSKGIDNLALRGERALFDMLSSIKCFNDMKVCMKIDLFDSLVKSVLCYGCEIWGFSDAKSHEAIHLRYLKNILCVRKSTPNCFIYRECNVYPLYILRILRIIKYWLKIISLNDFSPVKNLYNTALELNGMNNNSLASSWIENVKETLYKHGFGYVWEHQIYANDFDFFNTFKDRLIVSYWQENSSQIDSLSKNRLFRHLTTSSYSYLKEMPNNFIRIALTKLRLGSHYFMIERGRWKNLEYIDRLCIECNDIEDEFHVIVCYKRYVDLRKKYLPTYLYEKTSMSKFLDFLNCNSAAKLKKLGLFLHFVFILYEQNELFNSE